MEKVFYGEYCPECQKAFDMENQSLKCPLCGKQLEFKNMKYEQTMLPGPPKLVIVGK
jgi:endogenous inhibitor of DNA gyrase (YacG/DUF329 family)